MDLSPTEERFFVRLEANPVKVLEISLKLNFPRTVCRLLSWLSADVSRKSFQEKKHAM